MQPKNCASWESSSCPALCRASTSSLQESKKDVDGRDKPGHDDKRLFFCFGTSLKMLSAFRGKKEPAR
jgi:hypothetical protein